MKPAISGPTSNVSPLAVGVSVAAWASLTNCLYDGANAFPKCKNLIAALSPAEVCSVYNLLPSLVTPPLTVKSPAASVQIDSEINGFIISAPASLTPFTKLSNNCLSFAWPSWILFNKVLRGLAITS